MMATGQSVSAHHQVEQGLVGSLITQCFKFVFFLIVTLVVSIGIEWLGMTMFWAEQGSQHSTQMLETELTYLSTDFKHSVLVQTPKQFAKAFGNRFYHYSVQKTHLDQLIQWLAQQDPGQTTGFRARLRHWYGQTAQYLLAAVTMIQVFATRLAILALALPAFVLLSLVGMVDGLVQRDIRRWSGGRETSFVYHWAKRLVLPSIYLPWILYLAWPVSVHPNWIVLPFALLCAVSVAVMAGTFKKYL